MYLISAEGYKNAGVDMLIEKETGLIWAKMKNVHDFLFIYLLLSLELTK